VRPGDLSRLAIDFAFRFHASHHAACTVDRAVKRMFCGRILDAFENYGFFTHRSANKTLLPWERRSRAFLHHPQFLTLMCFAPSEIVMVVHFFQDLCAQNPRHPLAYPVTPRVRIRSSQVHAFKILRAQMGGCGNHARFAVHAVLRSGFLQEPGRQLVDQSA
jgi:hypothetical protein